ncbi:hypothetical protein [Salinispora tropica]|nr:hypothetical protein [Salinispora tropica]
MMSKDQTLDRLDEVDDHLATYLLMPAEFGGWVLVFASPPLSAA